MREERQDIQNLNRIVLNSILLILNAFFFFYFSPIPVFLCAVPLTHSKHSPLLSAEMAEDHNFQILNNISTIIQR